MVRNLVFDTSQKQSLYPMLYYLIVVNLSLSTLGMHFYIISITLGNQ